MKFSFVAVALLAARASAIPVAADDAAGTQNTHGALGLPGTEALTGLASKLGVPVEALAGQILGAVSSLLHVKRDGEGDDQVTHGSLGGLPGTDILTHLASKLGLPVETLIAQVLGAAHSLVPVKRGEEGVVPATENTVVDVDAANNFVNDLHVSLGNVLDKLFTLLSGLLKRDATANIASFAAPAEGLLKELLGTVDHIVKGGAKEVSKELKDTLSLLKGILGKILKSSNTYLDENTLIKVSVLNQALNNLLI